MDNIQILNIINFRNKNNLIEKLYTKDYVFQRSIAQLESMKFLNGIEISKHERKDCEIYYLRETFHEYFRKTN